MNGEPLMEHPTGEYATAIDAMEHAISRLRALPNGIEIHSAHKAKARLRTASTLPKSVCLIFWRLEFADVAQLPSKLGLSVVPLRRRGLLAIRLLPPLL